MGKELSSKHLESSLNKECKTSVQNQNGIEKKSKTT